MPTGEFQLGFIPSAPVNITYQEPDLTLNYEMDKLTFDLKVALGRFPIYPRKYRNVDHADPDVRIEYVGIRFMSPSAAPNYKPLDGALNALTFLSGGIKMKINAKYFGSLSYDPEDLYLLYRMDCLDLNPIKNFLPLLSTRQPILFFLQSTDDETLSFILMNPFRFSPTIPRCYPKRTKKT